MANTVSQAPLSNPGQGDGFSTVVVGSGKALKSLAENLAGLATKPPSLYLDAIGLGTGQVIDLELLILPKKTIYIVKMKCLGTTALSVTSDSGTSLRSILESESVPKVAFDIRGLSRILFHCYNLSLDGMYDLQLLELASRDIKESKKYLSGLAKCIDRDIPSTNLTKQCWLQPNDSTNMHMFNSLGHVTRDTMRRVELFPSLWSVYRRKLGRPGQAFWLSHARWSSEERVQDSKSNENTQDRQALGPTMWWNHELRQAATDEWNDQISTEENTG